MRAGAAIALLAACCGLLDYADNNGVSIPTVDSRLSMRTNRSHTRSDLPAGLRREIFWTSFSNQSIRLSDKEMGFVFWWDRGAVDCAVLT
jgi:hypothetical protein